MVALRRVALDGQASRDETQATAGDAEGAHPPRPARNARELDVAHHAFGQRRAGRERGGERASQRFAGETEGGWWVLGSSDSAPRNAETDEGRTVPHSHRPTTPCSPWHHMSAGLLERCVCVRGVWPVMFGSHCPRRRGPSPSNTGDCNARRRCRPLCHRRGLTLPTPSPRQSRITVRRNATLAPGIALRLIH